ncbi:MAG: trypsin-like peptidase domain-containing protein [Ignavibacteriaceae bacterium]|nr:trypsin-like peptidase domain-containing protein [Ignavibacterium sp.]MCC6255316.1 trypsin-like peptidase domain-containing protein [Ignavibacteriaceae bacterium]HRN27345.1 trypsin-like peptidase domain-containing protein [Ignavibacteriaceae bacterium]HRP93279.1 trypsin-like peptidase domain-containing protein [Ignavibacteriaceae bacterium]HRQ53680.1 trypsin-like peptidase domain-containing protein [Ignavibacteriaceae bacterium]
MITKKTFITTIVVITILFSASFFYLDSKLPDAFFTATNSKNVSLTSLEQAKKFNDDITNSRENIITNTVKKVSPAIVGINVIEIRQYQNPFGSFFDDPFFRQFFGNRGNSSQKVQGLGSGYIISPDGYIVTNDHVAGNATEITITMTDGSHHEAKIVGSDPVSDICLLKIDGNNLPYVELGDSKDIIIGEWVIALGNPFGLFELNDKPTVTVGVISATGMNLEPINERYYLNMIQTDAAINGGNSGGALVNSIGQIIGMNTLIYTAGGVQGNIGLGFAIPIDKVKKIVTELKANGKIDRDFQIGMSIQPIDAGIVKYYDLKNTKGVIVTKVLPNTPAENAGLKSGDIITEIDGYKISNEQTIFGVFQEFRVGQEIKVKIIRDNKELTKNMILERSK